MPPLHALTLALHMSVAICGADQVPGNELARAEAIAADVYRNIDIGVEWSEACDEARFSVRLVRSDAAEPDVTALDAALGYALSGTRVATVLSDRVGQFAHRYHVKREVLLGYAIAHEIGHLLLPPHSHALSGVMRASLDLERATARRLSFTPDEAALISRRVGDIATTVATN